MHTTSRFLNLLLTYVKKGMWVIPVNSSEIGLIVRWCNGLDTSLGACHGSGFCTGSNPVLTTDNNNSGVRVLLRREVVFSTVRVRVRWRIGDAADHKDDSRFDSCPDY